MWELLRRAALSLLALFVISFLVFLLTNVVPGSPASAVLDVDAPEEDILAWEREHNLHLPVTEQYAIWLRNTLSGNSDVTTLLDVLLAKSNLIGFHRPNDLSPWWEFGTRERKRICAHSRTGEPCAFAGAGAANGRFEGSSFRGGSPKLKAPLSRATG